VFSVFWWFLNWWWLIDDDVNHTCHTVYNSFVNPGSNLVAVMAVKGVLVVADHLRLIFTVWDWVVHVHRSVRKRETIKREKTENAGQITNNNSNNYSFHVGTLHKAGAEWRDSFIISFRLDPSIFFLIFFIYFQFTVWVSFYRFYPPKYYESRDKVKCIIISLIRCQVGPNSMKHMERLQNHNMSMDPIFQIQDSITTAQPTSDGPS